MNEPLPSPGGKRSRVFLSLLLIILFTLGCVYNFKDYFDKTVVGLQVTKNKSKNYPKEYNGCPIPQLIPSPPSLQHFFKYKGPKFDCEKIYPRLFNSTFESSLVPAKTLDSFRENGIVSCCYRTVERDLHSSKPDRAQIISSKCVPLSFTDVTRIPEEHHLIAIYCKLEGGNNAEKMVDVHSFVHLKPKNNPIHSLSKGTTADKRRKYNVVIFGLDSVSRMNFLRKWKKSHDFLKTELGAVDMLAYNKVGENTFPSLLPLLTSKTQEELRCLKNEHFDDCPFIWKEFSKEGYHTGYSEDAIVGSLFTNGKPGFKKQPTDHYPLPLADWAGKHTSERYCYGPRLSFQFLIEAMEKFVQKMGENGQNYFHFTLATRLTHDLMNIGDQGDPHLLRSLRWLKKEGHLNDTIFILVSDHGMIRSDFEFQETIQGQLEKRLPFAYFVLPESFKMEYKRAYENLIRNRDRLMTTFDMHETLKDILSLRTIEESSLIKREALSDLGETPTRGISLFLPIPKFRTCKMAGVPPIYCACFPFRWNQTSPEVANAVVAHINAILDKFSQCTPLQLDRVTIAGHTSDQEYEAYVVNFITKPGGAQFEAFVRRRRGQKDGWRVLGNIDRTNYHHDRSKCVEAGQLRNYCQCRILPNTPKL